jgi:hypothetical protein
VVGLADLVGLMEEADQIVAGPSAADSFGVVPSGVEPSASGVGPSASGVEAFVEVDQVVAGLMEGEDLAEEVPEEVVPL